MSQDWNNPDFQADIAREAVQAGHKIEELQAQVAKMRKALEEIHRTAMYDNGSAPAPFCFVLAFNDIKEKAREALKDLPPT